MKYQKDPECECGQWGNDPICQDCWIDLWISQMWSDGLIRFLDVWKLPHEDPPIERIWEEYRL